MPSSTQRFYLQSNLREKNPESAILRAEGVFRHLVGQLNKAKLPITLLPGEALPTGILYGQPLIDLRSGIPVLQFWDGTKLVNAGASIQVFPDLNDTPVSYAGSGGKVVAVKAGEDGLEFITASSVDQFTDLIDTPSSLTGEALKLVRVNAGETALEFAAPPTVYDQFTDLTDTPSSLTGQALKLVRVNSGETALEFWTLVMTFLGLTDTPSSFSGQGNKLVRVNAGETALEFVSPSVGGVTNFTDLGDVDNSYTGDALKVLRVDSGETGIEFHTPSFLDASDAPSSFTGHGLKHVRVNSGETALEFTADIDATKLQGVTVDTTAPTNGQHLEYDSTAAKWKPATPSAGGGSAGPNLGFIARLAATDTSFNSGSNIVDFDDVIYDPDSETAEDGSGNLVWTPGQAGVIKLSGAINTSGTWTSTQSLTAVIYKNGTQVASVGNNPGRGASWSYFDECNGTTDNYYIQIYTASSSYNLLIDGTFIMGEYLYVP